MKPKRIDIEHVCPKCIKDGDVLYIVYALEEKSFIQKIVIIGQPYYHNNIGWFCKYESEGGYENDFSLQDAGIIPNTYNNHKTFVHRENAEKYLKKAKEIPQWR